MFGDGMELETGRWRCSSRLRLSALGYGSAETKAMEVQSDMGTDELVPGAGQVVMGDPKRLGQIDSLSLSSARPYL